VREIERAGIPTTLVTAMTTLASSMGCYRIVTGTMIPCPWGDPKLPSMQDLDTSRRIFDCCLDLLQREVTEPTVVHP
jgi:glycine/betaine/sarcosine/D-proline reductase family selenoprotein B